MDCKCHLPLEYWNLITSKVTQFWGELKFTRFFNFSYHGESVHLSSPISVLSSLKQSTNFPSKIYIFQHRVLLIVCKNWVVMYSLWHRLYKSCWFSYFVKRNTLMIISKNPFDVPQNLAQLSTLKRTLPWSIYWSIHPFMTLLINQMGPLLFLKNKFCVLMMSFFFKKVTFFENSHSWNWKSKIKSLIATTTFCWVDLVNH